jgi:hypothetical protein
MQRIVVLSVSAAAMAAWAASAVADSPNLKGAYGFTSIDNCISTPVTPNGFTSDLRVAVPPARLNPGVQGGIITFNGDGTGTATGSVFGFHYGPTSRADAATLSFLFTYTVKGDGTWTGIATTPGTGTGTAGILNGQPYTIISDPNLSFGGRISQHGSTLTVGGGGTPTVETVTFPDAIPPSALQQICHPSYVLIKLRSAQ